ncbi:MAG TPA: CvpA family protein [Candidatus Evtepia faecigallinarum]|nr:CvpA family protein [Candidatus Evtepia faecigallinarum]
MSDSQAKRTMPRMLISLLITLVIGAVWFYVSLPAINLHNTGFYSFVFVLLLVYILVFMIVLGVDTGKQEIHLRDYLSFAKSQCKIVVIAIAVLAVLFVVGQILSAPIFRASSYHELLQVDTGDFATEIEPVSYDEIPMLDEASASVLGDRKLGELSDMVSQFDVSQDYAQINYKGRPVRVAALEYGDFFKWFLNTKEGLPAYITVDMVTQEADVVRLSDLGLEGMRYSPSEYFNRDLNRFLRFHYPTYMFSAPHLEINDEGEPYWICPRETRTIGLFGGSDIIGAVMLNACTGEHVYYDVADIPSWVDRVYTASLIVQQYDYYGTYVNGFINSLIGQKDVTVTTENFNYLAMDDDVYMYTGITSASSDQSNIGFLLSNQRTKETTYYPAPGAIESSAQRSAEGVVQDLGYTATFPLLLNIGGQPTYFMSLKDSSQLVKMYAMVNVSQYQIVAQGTTVAACESDYLTQLQARGIEVNTEGSHSALEQTAVEGVVAEIRTAVLNGDSWYYVRLDGSDTFYAMAAATDRNVVILNVGDQVTILVTPGAEDAAIINALSISTGKAKPDPVETDASTDTGAAAEPAEPAEE